MVKRGNHKRHITLSGKPATGMKSGLHFGINKKGNPKILSGSGQIKESPHKVVRHHAMYRKSANHPKVRRVSKHMTLKSRYVKKTTVRSRKRGK